MTALDQNLRSSTKFTTGPMGLVPHVNIGIGEGTESLIREIIVGPSSHPDEAEKAVRMLLDASDIPRELVTIKRSEIPLRPITS